MLFNKYITSAISVVVGVVALFIGGRMFTYFTYNAPPVVAVVGVEDGGHYKGVVACSLNAANGYKVSAVTVMLDGAEVPVDGAASIGAKEFSIPFDLDTAVLADGKHLLQIESVDSSYHANKSSEQFEFFVDNKPLRVSFLQSEYKVLQGRTLQPKLQVNKPLKRATVKVFSKEYNCHPVSDDSTLYESFVPVECEQHADEYLLSLEAVDNVGNKINLASSVRVAKATFIKQKGFYIPPEKLDDEKDVSMNNRILGTALEKWQENSERKKLWSGPFEVPTVIKRVSTPFGEIRITPEKGRYLHRAIDIVNDPKAVVWASHNGKVIIKDRYLMTGNTVVLDHGCGVFTKYFHLDDFADIEVGDLIKKGAPVGRLGMTGYANGYHLHWELTVNGVPVEPIEWTKRVY